MGLLRSPEGLRAVTREEMKFIDSTAMESFRIPGGALMETAGRAVAEAVTDLAGGDVAGKAIAVLCGTGANGGDGFVAARLLANAGAAVTVYRVGRGGTLADHDAANALHAVERMGLPVVLVQTAQGAGRALAEIARADVVVDAILGTGLSGLAGRVREPAATLIERLNALGKPVVAVDIPSGLDANTGEKIGVCVKATVTVTMGLPKVGFAAGDGPAVTGRVRVANLGYPRTLLETPQGLHLARRQAPAVPPRAEPEGPEAPLRSEETGGEGRESRSGS